MMGVEYLRLRKGHHDKPYKRDYLRFFRIDVPIRRSYPFGNANHFRGQ